MTGRFWPLGPVGIFEGLHGAFDSSVDLEGMSLIEDYVRNRMCRVRSHKPNLFGVHPNDGLCIHVNKSAELRHETTYALR
ncbi:hypothetical protein BQ8794_30341 [Mesorhizobium prunaredense]|uniref:Uncharacterized protein n=1 Tax=Mesorhizobium prunaredense TaxID=1631249 RepID=A0A1R3VDK9_9HYPH|nr:hypothetical protein BQ8794_30341 [Mesorhizobium prunaredense]